MQQKQYLRQSILKAFAQYSSMPEDTLLDQKNYLNFLDFLAQNRFDREIALELFSQCAKKQNIFITVNDFIDVFFKAEDELVRQISLVNQKINDLNEQREDLMIKLDDNSANKKSNKLVEQQQNQLQINLEVQTAQITNSTFQMDSSSYFVVAECGGVSKATQTSNDFYFNSKLSLSVNKDSHILNLYLTPQNKKSADPFVGKIQLNILQMPPNQQIPIQEYFKSSYGQQIPIYLQFVITILPPKLTSKYEDKYGEKNKKISEKENQLKEIDQNLKSLYMLIRHLDEINSKNKGEIKDLEQQMRLNKNIEYLKNSPSKNQQLQFELQSREQLISNTYNQTKAPPPAQILNSPNNIKQKNKQSIDIPPQQHVQQQNLNQQKLISTDVPYSYDERILIRNFKIVIAIFLFISTLQSLEKPAFLEISCLLAMLGLLCSDDLDDQIMLFLGGLLVLQLIQDFTWTMLYDLTDYYERFKSVDNSNSKYLMIFCYCTMIICFFYKFFFLNMAYLYYNSIAVKLEDIKNRAKQ